MHTDIFLQGVNVDIAVAHISRMNTQLPLQILPLPALQVSDSSIWASDWGMASYLPMWVSNVLNVCKINAFFVMTKQLSIIVIK